jgi:hypothetical protein
VQRLSQRRADDQCAAGHNPHQAWSIYAAEGCEPLTYLGGGRDFGQIGPITSSSVPPHIISRNLTPDATGIPVGGFGSFLTA